MSDISPPSEAECPNGPDPVRAVLFDAVGTLFRTRGTIGEIYSDVASRHGVVAAPGQLDERFDSLTRAQGIPIDKTGWRSLVAEVFAAADRFDSFDAFFEELYTTFRTASGWRLFPETKSLLEHLRLRGVQVGVVTNFDDRIHRVLEDLGIANHFGCVQTAEAWGVRKPDPHFFAKAAAALEVTPQETLVVGDDAVQDFEGARRAGMRALLVDRRPDAPDARFVIRSLEEILPHLGLTPNSHKRKHL